LQQVLGAAIADRQHADFDAILRTAAVFGYMVMNDWSARMLQMEEMKLSLGPCKGKDFATSLGPWLVTKDELAIEGSPKGELLHAAMTCDVSIDEVGFSKTAK